LSQAGFAIGVRSRSYSSTIPSGQRRFRLQQFYGLTPAEATVTTEVLRGQGLQAAAETLGITIPTVRTHLQHVFEKTRTRRQAELVRMLAENNAGLRIDTFVSKDGA
jgi:DNA-binding CsgD family transcriptional regulator